SFGMVLIEAMACGRPVVAHRLPGVRSVVRHGIDGLLVPPGDLGELVSSLDKLLSNPGLRREMGGNGRARVESTYTWARVVEQRERVYQKALGSEKRPIQATVAPTAVLSTDR